MDIILRKRQFERRREETAKPSALRKGMRSAQASRWYADAYAENLGESPALREARALKALWSHCDIEIWPEERVAGVLTAYEPLCFNYGSGTVINEEARDALAAENNYTPEQRRELDALLAEADKRRYRAAEPSVHTEAEIKSINAVAATSTFFGCHMILDYETILQIGLDGYRAEIARQRARHPAGKNEFYDVMDTMLDAVIIYLERSALAADGELRGVFGRIAHMPPATFHEAIQLVWTMHMLNGCDSFGRFDGYMLPFFQKDDPDNAYSLIVDLMLKIEQVGQIQNMCIGGVDENGDDNCSELTRLIIKATRELGYKGPNLCLFVTPTTPDTIWDEALRCIASGIGLPALYNNGIFVDTLVRAGYPLKEARGFSLAGCSQLMIPGQCNFMNDIGMFNAMKVGEIALFDGYDPRTRGFAGIRTGESFDSFEALYRAVLEQLDYFIGLEVSMHDRDIRHRASREGYAMRTLFIRGCLENAGYIMDGGARYNNVELEVIGITNLADHLWAIKQLVFDEHRVSYAEMKDALANNWEGRETLRGLCRNAPKFGNGHDGVDDLRADLTRHIYKKFNEAPGTLGGVFVPGEVIFTAHDWTGKATGATADGRMAGDVLADSAGASQGMDLNGPTALMRSVLKLPVKDYMLTSTVLNLRFLPSIMKTPQSAERVRKLFETFFKQGGMQMQINVCDSDELRAAREDPDGHRSLIVRVGGYSAYFVRLPAALQDEIITRTAHSA